MEEEGDVCRLPETFATTRERNPEIRNVIKKNGKKREGMIRKSVNFLIFF